MSAQDIIAQLPKLSSSERRAIARQIFELKPDVHYLPGNNAPLFDWSSSAHEIAAMNSGQLGKAGACA
jgi:hypothetical protein